MQTSQMTLNEYQDEAKQTRGTQCDRLYLGVKLLEEASEASQPVIKEHYHGKAVDVSHLMDELGDVLWYIATLADDFGWSLQDVAEYNIQKLRNRHGTQYSSQHYK